MAATGVRTATAGDVPVLVALHCDTWRAAYARLLPAEVLDGLRELRLTGPLDLPLSG